MQGGARPPSAACSPGPCVAPCPPGGGCHECGGIPGDCGDAEPQDHRPDGHGGLCRQRLGHSRRRRQVGKKAAARARQRRAWACGGVSLQLGAEVTVVGWEARPRGGAASSSQPAAEAAGALLAWRRHPPLPAGRWARPCWRPPAAPCWRAACRSGRCGWGATSSTACSRWAARIYLPCLASRWLPLAACQGGSHRFGTACLPGLWRRRAARPSSPSSATACPPARLPVPGPQVGKDARLDQFFQQPEETLLTGPSK